MAIRDYQWGCGFTEGFRVPLLVVSPYTPPGYVSGACVGTSCTNDQFPYQHDFGSILAFTEYNFTMQFIAKPFYADYNAHRLVLRPYYACAAIRFLRQHHIQLHQHIDTGAVPVPVLPTFRQLRAGLGAHDTGYGLIDVQGGCGKVTGSGDSFPLPVAAGRPPERHSS